MCKSQSIITKEELFIPVQGVQQTSPCLYTYVYKYTLVGNSDAAMAGPVHWKVLKARGIFSVIINLKCNVPRPYRTIELRASSI